MRWFVVPIVVVCVAWFIVVLAYSLNAAQTDIAPVGTALSPIGWMLTALAIGIGFKQRHDDATRAYVDKLATAYTKWFDEAWHIVGKMVDEMDAAIQLKDIPTLARTVDAIHARERSLRTAATALLMLERTAERATRIRGTFSSLPSWGKKVVNAEIDDYRTFTVNLVTVLRERRDDIEQLFSDAGRAFAPTAPTPPTPPPT